MARKEPTVHLGNKPVKVLLHVALGRIGILPIHDSIVALFGFLHLTTENSLISASVRNVIEREHVDANALMEVTLQIIFGKVFRSVHTYFGEKVRNIGIRLSSLKEKALAVDNRPASFLKRS